MSRKSSFWGRKRQFNISYAAVIRYNCRYRPPKKGLSGGITAAQKKLNCRIYRPQILPHFAIALIINILQKPPKMAVFASKYTFVDFDGILGGQFCDK